jgi:hypothetical protein
MDVQKKNRDFQVAKNISHWSDTKVNTKKSYKKKILVVRSVQGARSLLDFYCRFRAFLSASDWTSFGGMAEHLALRWLKICELIWICLFGPHQVD